MGILEGLWGRPKSQSGFVLDELPDGRDPSNPLGKWLASLSESEVSLIRQLRLLMIRRLELLEQYFAQSPARAKHRNYETWVIQGGFQLLMLDILVIGTELRLSQRSERVVQALGALTEQSSKKHAKSLFGPGLYSDFETAFNERQHVFSLVMNNFISRDDKTSMRGVAQITNLILFAPMLRDERVIATIGPMAYYSAIGSIDFDLRNNAIDFTSFMKCVDLAGLRKGVLGMLNN